MKQGEVVQLTEWINTKPDGKEVYKLQEENLNRVNLVMLGVVSLLPLC